MKKSVIFGIFVLGTLFGLLVYKLHMQWQYIQYNQPQEISIDTDSFLYSISDVINKKHLTSSERFYRFEEIDTILDDGYYNTGLLASGNRIESAIKAYVDGIDDPYTMYFNAQQQSGFKESLKGEADFEGIGAVVTKKDYYVLIEEVLKGSPAFDAGLMPLDRIVGVGSGTVKDLDINAAVNLIKGPKGTKVLLTIERRDRKDVVSENGYELLSIEVTRDKLLVPSVRTRILSGENNNNIAYIDIAMIGEETERILRREIDDLKKEGFDSIILDLRGNGGGFLSVAVRVASHFVPKDKHIVTAKYRLRENEVFSSFGFDTLQEYPVVVLVNGMTASAGEIITLALQEQIGATALGTTSFGKGSIQSIELFDDGDSMKYTVGKWYAPSGKTIDKVGIQPDIVLEFDVENYQENRVDNQLQEAIRILSK